MKISYRRARLLSASVSIRSILWTACATFSFTSHAEYADYSGSNSIYVPAYTAPANTQPSASIQSFANVTTGVASWVGDKYQGKRTASGEMFDMYQMTAAHRNMPFNSYARITNIDNGRSTVVRVNDRGPYTNDLVMNVSYAAAQQLDMIRTGGRANIRIEELTDSNTGNYTAAQPTYSAPPVVLRPDTPAQPAPQHPAYAVTPAPTYTPPQPTYPPSYPQPAYQTVATPQPVAPAQPTFTPPSTNPVELPQEIKQPTPAPAAVNTANDPVASGVWLQVGAFRVKGSADDVARKLKTQGFNNVNISPTSAPYGYLYRVRTGPYNDTKNTQAFVQKLNALGYTVLVTTLNH